MAQAYSTEDNLVFLHTRTQAYNVRTKRHVGAALYHKNYLNKLGYIKLN